MQADSLSSEPPGKPWNLEVMTKMHGSHKFLRRQGLLYTILKRKIIHPLFYEWSDVDDVSHISSAQDLVIYDKNNTDL